MATAPQQTNPWEGLASLNPGVDVSGLNPLFSGRMQALMKAAEAATGGSVDVTSGYRTPQHQAQIYANYTQKPVTYGGVTYAPNGTSGVAAPPGHSEHNSGSAMDINPTGPAYSWMVQHAPDFGVQSLAYRNGKPFDLPHFQLPPSQIGQQAPQNQAATQVASAAPSAAPVVPMTPMQSLGDHLKNTALGHILNFAQNGPASTNGGLLSQLSSVLQGQSATPSVAAPDASGGVPTGDGMVPPVPTDNPIASLASKALGAMAPQQSQGIDPNLLASLGWGSAPPVQGNPLIAQQLAQQAQAQQPSYRPYFSAIVPPNGNVND